MLRAEDIVRFADAQAPPGASPWVGGRPIHRPDRDRRSGSGLAADLRCARTSHPCGSRTPGSRYRARRFDVRTGPARQARHRHRSDRRRLGRRRHVCSAAGGRGLHAPRPRTLVVRAPVPRAHRPSVQPACVLARLRGGRAKSDLPRLAAPASRGSRALPGREDRGSGCREHRRRTCHAVQRAQTGRHSRRSTVARSVRPACWTERDGPTLRLSDGVTARVQPRFETAG